MVAEVSVIAVTVTPEMVGGEGEEVVNGIDTDIY